MPNKRQKMAALLYLKAPSLYNEAYDRGSRWYRENDPLAFGERVELHHKGRVDGDAFSSAFVEKGLELMMEEAPVTIRPIRE